MPHRMSKGEREKEMVSGGHVDAIFVLVEIEMTVIVDSFGSAKDTLVLVLMVLD